ncbi:MFS transporter [Bartonella sp. LJL80]
MEDQYLDKAVRLAKRRIVPFLLLMYVLAFLDRANIGFAKETFQISTGISDAAYALGAGLFFISYALLEIPSNLIMHRVGAKIWMCRIMVTWGLISAGMMFVENEISFYTMRVLLGAAEAGFFPGVILYLTYWFPDRSRGQMMGLFYFGVPLSFILGGPLSGLLLEMHDLGGLEGWQWMFLIEGLLASAVGVWAYFYLDNKPKDANWLPQLEKQALVKAMQAQDDDRGQHGLKDMKKVFFKPVIIHLLAIYALIQMSVYGVVFYFPEQVASLLGTKVGLKVGFVSTIPWLFAMVAIFYLPRLADRKDAHRSIGGLTLLCSAIGIAVSVSAPPIIALIALCFAAAGFFAVQPTFWVFPTSYLGGKAAAAGIGLINSFGALGSFIAPNLKNWADHNFGTGSGLYALAIAATIGAIMIFLIPRWRKL